MKLNNTEKAICGGTSTIAIVSIDNKCDIKNENRSKRCTRNSALGYHSR